MDTALSVVIGLAASGIVALTITAFSITAPLWITISAVVGVSMVISSIVNYYEIPDTLDNNANMLIDDLQGE